MSQAEEGPGDRTMSATRSLSPLKTSPSLMFKTPSLVNITGDQEPESLKDARIRELEEVILALRGELTSIRSQSGVIPSQQPVTVSVSELNSQSSVIPSQQPEPDPLSLSKPVLVTEPEPASESGPVLTVEETAVDTLEDEKVEEEI